MNRNPFVNIIVPVYNEKLRIETSIQELISHLRRSAFPYPYAITIVNNGSTDDTAACIERITRAHGDVVHVLELEEKGKGRAIRAGWREPGDIMSFMDADLSSDLDYFLPLIDAIARDGFDFAVGNRLGRSSEISGRKFIRGLVSRLYNGLVRFLFGTNLDDHQCGFKAIRKDAYLTIAPLLVDTGWFFDTELIVYALRCGYCIRSIDIKWRDDRRTKVSLVRTPLDMLGAIYTFRRRLRHAAAARPLSEQRL